MCISELNPALPLSWLQLGHPPLKLFCSLPAPRVLIFFPPQPITSADEDRRAPQAPRCSRQVCCCGVQSCSQAWLLQRALLGVPRWGDGVTAPWGLAVGLASVPCSGEKKGFLCLWFVAWEGGVAGVTQELAVGCL